MATGIRRRHSAGCRSREGGRCDCRAGWEATVYLSRERRRVSKTFRREAEARSWRADMETAARRQQALPGGVDTRQLRVALRDFVERMESGEVRPKGRAAYKPSTIRGYDQVLRCQVEDSALGSIRVQDLRRRDVQDFADDLLASGLAPGTIGNVLSLIQAFFRREIDRERLAYNPSERIDLPTPGSGRPRRIVSAPEAAELLEVLRPADRPIWATAFYAGLRRGELQALRVRDVDLQANLINVERGWDQEEGVIDPKSRASLRTVPLLGILSDLLKECIRGSGRGGEDLIFGRTTRLAFFPSTIDHRAKRAWTLHNEREGIRAVREEREPRFLTPITLHGCRHTFASLLIDAGANPKAIQEFMGHAKIQTTFETYGHLLPGSRDEIRMRMDAYLGGS